MKRLEELAVEIKNSRAKDESKGKQVEVDHGSGLKGSSSKKNAKDGIGNANQEALDELYVQNLFFCLSNSFLIVCSRLSCYSINFYFRLAASLAAEEEGKFNSNASASGVDAFEEGVDEDDENEEMLFVSYISPSFLYLFV